MGARAIPLKVSGAWHSELMQGAEEEFEEFLATVDFRPPQTRWFTMSPLTRHPNRTRSGP